MKITQTGILWSQVQVLVGPPEYKNQVRDSWGFLLSISFIGQHASQA